MRKRKYGYILLTLLVVSGLAGIPSGNTINGKERKFAAEYMKHGRTGVLKNLKALSETQLNFRPAKGAPGIQDCIFKMANAELGLWNLLEKTMKSPSNPGKRKEIKIKDEEVAAMAGNRGSEKFIKENITPGSYGFRSAEQALHVFKTKRSEHIKYIKYTTEDLRNHVVETPMGWMDCYQLCLFIAAQTNRYARQIEEIKAHPRFPKQ